MAHGPNRTSAAALLLLGCLIVQSAAMPMHPDLLSFVKLPAANSASEELQQTAARKLQQNNDLFREGEGPFSFDGFDFGFGGLFPGGGFFDGFGLNIYNILFRDILNEGNLLAVAGGIPNSLQPFDYIPSTIGDRFNKDVAVLFGFDAVDKFLGQYLTRATASVGELVDAGCVGPTYTITVNGGECEILDDGSVECEPPFIELSETPFICNLPYREAAQLEGQSYKFEVEFGKEREGEVGLAAGEYNFGAAVNVTVPYLGVSLNTRTIADDFGVQQWWQFVGNLILNELLRIQAALLSGAVDERIINEPVGRSAPIVDGVAAVVDAGSMLLDRIAKQMGINTDDLSAGLKAVGVVATPPAQPAQQQGKGGNVEKEPQVQKAEGAQPQPKAAPRAAAKPAPKPAPKPAAKPAAKKASEPKRH